MWPETLSRRVHSAFVGVVRLRAKRRETVASAGLLRVTLPLAVLIGSVGGCGLIVRQTTIGYLAVDSRFAPKHVEIEINRAFIERYKNRVEIQTTFTVDKAMGSPLPSALDGDLHFAGRAPQVALPIVAEITNAAHQKAATDMVHRVERTPTHLEVSGVWRIWAEHPATSEEAQGQPVPPIDTDNPDHVFEIHPVTRINDLLLLDSFTPVKGFTPGGADRTFAIYEKASCVLRVNPKTISIVTETGLYNDVEFIIQLSGQPQLIVGDGRFVIASAFNLDGKQLVARLRLVFAKDTPPDRAVRALHAGDRLHVYGIPRLNFAEISQRVQDSGKDPSVLSKSLPYEMIILGVYAK